jgi:hypothetical protein
VDENYRNTVVHPYVEPETVAKALGPLAEQNVSLLVDLNSATFVRERYYVSFEQFLIDLGPYQIRWTDRWEFGVYPLPEHRHTYRCQGYTFANGEPLNLVPDLGRYERECTKAVKIHTSTMETIRAKHKQETDDLYFELKCLECDIELLETRVGLDTPAQAYEPINRPRDSKQLVFGPVGLQKQYSDYLRSTVGRWLFSAPRLSMVPLTRDVVLLRDDWCSVLHTCQMLQNVRHRGSRVVSIATCYVDRGYVVDDEFWFLSEDKWEGVSLRLEELGNAVTGSRPSEPVYQDVYGYQGAMTVRCEETREMLWIGFMTKSGKAHVLGTIPY